ncbi:MAG: hypothetical protein IPL34_20230 [Thiofilum sp.]|uniref:hypothetical protein n=1 Tax=Thiofilum sp. TaxID=2212733 RepID=UPI0025D124E6|nr:hypothetical protein [Thiofilum sp.]MBK8455610.1 hypothetical protein [Thiofilum sp.]
MNLSHFKKISEDDKCAMLMHPDGHKISVAKAMLNPKMRSMLGEMPMHMAEGGMVEDPENPMNLEVMDPLSPAIHTDGRAPASAPSAIPEPVQPGFFDNIGSALHWPGSSAVAAEAPKAPLPPAGEEIKFETASAPMNPPIMAQRAPQSMAAPIIAPGIMEGMRSGIGMQQAGIQEEAAGQAKQSQAQAALYEDEATQLERVRLDSQVKMDELNGEITKLSKDVTDGHIDPNNWWASKSDGAKVGTVIGLLLGGIGAGLTGKENMASEYIDQQINRDIDAQKANLNKKSNLLSMYYQQLGNLRDAEVMTRASMKDLYASKIQATALKTQNPIIAARAKQAIGSLKFSTERELAPLAMKQSILGGIQQGKVDPSVAARFVDKENQPAAYKEAEHAKELQSHIDNFSSAFWNAANKRRDVNENLFGQAVSQLNAPVAGMVRMVEGGISDASIKKFQEQINPKKTDTEEQVQQRYQNGINQLMQKAHFPVLESYGASPSILLKPRPNPNARYGKK